jgi:hypothetical protein
MENQAIITAIWPAAGGGGPEDPHGVLLEARAAAERAVDFAATAYREAQRACERFRTLTELLDFGGKLGDGLPVREDTLEARTAAAGEIGTTIIEAARNSAEGRPLRLAGERRFVVANYPLESIAGTLGKLLAFADSPDAWLALTNDDSRNIAAMSVMPSLIWGRD